MSSVTPASPSNRISSTSVRTGCPGEVSGDHETRRSRVAQLRECAVHVAARKAKTDRQAPFPSVALGQERDRRNRVRRMRDPAPAEDSLPVGHQAVDAELKLPLRVLVHEGIKVAIGSVSRPCSRSRQDRHFTGAVPSAIGTITTDARAADPLATQWRASCKMRPYPALCCHTPLARAPSRSMSDELPFTGERFIPGVPGEIWYEHWHRYHFAAPHRRWPRRARHRLRRGLRQRAARAAAAHVTGADIAQPAIDHARARYARCPISQFRQADCAALPFPDASFDAVVSFETLEHIAAQEAVSRRSPARAAPGRPARPVVPEQGRVHRQARRDQRVPRPRALS